MFSVILKPIINNPNYKFILKTYKKAMKRRSEFKIIVYLLIYKDGHGTLN